MREIQILRGLHKARASMGNNFAGGFVPDTGGHSSLLDTAGDALIGMHDYLGDAVKGLGRALPKASRFLPTPSQGASPQRTVRQDLPNGTAVDTHPTYTLPNGTGLSQAVTPTQPVAQAVPAPVAAPTAAPYDTTLTGAAGFAARNPNAGPRAMPTTYAQHQGAVASTPAAPAAPVAPLDQFAPRQSGNTFGDAAAFSHGLTAQSATTGLAPDGWSAAGRSNGRPTDQDMAAGNALGAGQIARNGMQSQRYGTTGNVNDPLSMQTVKNFADGMVPTAHPTSLRGMGNAVSRWWNHNPALDRAPQQPAPAPQAAPAPASPTGISGYAADSALDRRMKEAGLARGAVSLKGPGTTTSDSIHNVSLSKGESVLPAKTTAALGPENIARLIQQTNGKPPAGLRAGGHYSMGAEDWAAESAPWYKPAGAGFSRAAGLVRGAAPWVAAGAIGKGAYQGMNDTADQKQQFNNSFGVDENSGMLRRGFANAARYANHIGMAVPGVPTLVHAIYGDDTQPAAQGAPAGETPDQRTAHILQQANGGDMVANGAPKLGDTRNVDTARGTMDQFTALNSADGKPVWQSVSTDDAKLGRLADAANYTQQLKSSADASRADTQRQLDYFQAQHDRDEQRGLMSQLGPHTRANLMASQAQNATSLRNAQLQAQTSMYGDNLRRDSSLGEQGVQREGNHLQYQGKLRQLAYDQAVRGHDWAKDANTEFEGSAEKSPFVIGTNKAGENAVDPQAVADLRQFRNAGQWDDGQGHKVSIRDMIASGNQDGAAQATTAADTQFGIGQLVNKVAGTTLFGKPGKWGPPELDDSDPNGPIHQGRLDDWVRGAPGGRVALNSLGIAPGQYGRMVTFKVNGQKQEIPLDMLTKDPRNGGQYTAWLNQQLAKRGKPALGGALTGE